ncbi:MAG: GNAT family N-acetyltransferase [Candidatus Izemoplasmatales bacterium]
MKELRTKRLILRSWTLADAADLFEYAKLSTVGPLAGWKPHENIDESREIIKNFMQAGNVWAIEHREDQKVIGSVGLHFYKRGQNPGARELGYVLSTKYEHQGLMTEACREVLRHTFSETEIDTVYVCHFLENHKSQRVIEKCGFAFIEDRDYQSKDNRILKSRYYMLTKDQYFSNGGEK